MRGTLSRRTLLAVVSGVCGLGAGCAERVANLDQNNPTRPSATVSVSKNRPTCTSTDAAQLVVIRPLGALVKIEETLGSAQAVDEARKTFERSVPDNVEIQLRAVNDRDESRQADTGKRTGSDTNIRFLGEVSVSTARMAVEDAGFTIIRAHPGVSQRLAASMRASLESRITELSDLRDVSGRGVSLALANDGAPLLVASFAERQEQVRQVLRVGGHVRLRFTVDAQTKLTATYADIADFGQPRSSQRNKYYVPIVLAEEFRTRLGDLVRSTESDSMTVSMYYDSAVLADELSLTPELVNEIASGRWDGTALIAVQTASEADAVVTALEKGWFRTPVETEIESC